MLYEFNDRYGQSWAIEMPESGVGVLRSPLNSEQPLRATDALGSEVLRLVGRVAALEAENSRLRLSDARLTSLRLEAEVLKLEIRRVREAEQRAVALRIDLAAAIRTGEEQGARLSRLDALMASDEPPEGLNTALWAWGGSSAADIAWSWFRKQLGEKHS